MQLIRAYCSWWWLILEVETPDIGKYLYYLSVQGGLELPGSVRTPVDDGWYMRIFIPLISAYCNSWRLVLEVKIPGIIIYLYHKSMRTATDDALY